MTSSRNKILSVNGSLFFDGDKSLSHRAAILSALATGTSSLQNFLPAQDTQNTLTAMECLGVRVRHISKQEIEIASAGIKSSEQNQLLKIDVGNSGTGARLLLGLFAGMSNLQCTIDGDASLRKRPMRRVTTPLANFGAVFEPSDFLPIQVRGQKLLPIIFQETLGSAQVKSAMIFAALASQIPLRLQEEIPSRDHTENMLSFAGIHISKVLEETGSYVIEMEPPYHVMPKLYKIWGDISSAAFFVVLGLLAQQGSLRIKDVLLNPYRDAYLRVLQRMGAKIEIHAKENQCGERGGDILVFPSRLRGTNIREEEIPALIDELPILTIAGLFAEGEFSFRGAKELRVKESDRITALCSNLRSCGVEVQEFEDGLSLRGHPLQTLSGEIESFMDHRIVMSFEIAKLRAQTNVKNADENSTLTIKGKEWVQTSFPSFYQKLNEVTHA